jgi:hypothetical protein
MWELGISRCIIKPYSDINISKFFSVKDADDDVPVLFSLVIAGLLPLVFVYFVA